MLALAMHIEKASASPKQNSYRNLTKSKGPVTFLKAIKLQNMCKFWCHLFYGISLLTARKLIINSSTPLILRGGVVICLLILFIFLGQHFTKLGQHQGIREPVPDSSKSKDNLDPEDEKRMKKLLADPEIQEILLDPRIKQLFNGLKQNPEMAQL